LPLYFLNLIILLVFFFPRSLFSYIQPPLLVGSEDIFKKPGSNLTSNEKKPSKPPIFWGGSSLTEKKMDNLPVTMYIISGGAWLRHQDIRLTAHSIEIIGEDAIKAELKGRVTVEDQKNGSVLSALHGDYDKLSDKVILEGDPRLVYTDSEKNKTYISAKKITRYLQEGRTILEGRIYITNDNLAIIGEDAVYHDSTKTLTMENRPLVFAEYRFLSGKYLLYRTDLQEVSLEEEAFLIQKKLEEVRAEDKSATETGGEMQWVTTISSADRMVKRNFFGESSVLLEGNARILRPDFEFYANFLRNYTKKNTQEEILEAKGDILFKDLKNSTTLLGEILEHFPARGYSHLTGNPKIHIGDKDGKPTATIQSVEVERFEEKKEIVIRGDVQIVSEASRAFGEFATYYEEEEKIILEGDPTLERDGKKLHSGKIILYPRDDRVILSEGLNVQESE